ncbi:SDR family NAD(P)-dependent oxidoreductase [Actinocorallia libanotica]|uniref:SDR family NAD(P)-dependent oxidoreductase n=1 Tax=Actinocorallia libanotica TaxID=46162 RepID=UPI0031CF68EE
MTERGVVIITGGNRGIGLAAAELLAARGLKVVLVARRREQGEAAVARLGAGAELVVGDLADRARTAALADVLGERFPDIRALVHNAGIWPSRRELNADGFEQAFFTNHLAPFLLDHLLEERLKASGSAVVRVSAGLYVKGKVDPERTPTGADFHPIRTYADTKLANLLMLPLLAERWKDAGVTVNALHPGVIRTGLGDRRGPVGLLLKAIKRTWQPPEAGGRPVARLVTDPPAASGAYFDVDKETPLEPVALDTALAERLWADASAALDVS